MKAREASAAALALFLAAALGGGELARAETRVVNLLIDPEGLPALHQEQEDGPPVMWLPQLRLFDAEGRPLWARTLMPARRKEFRRELERRVASREPLTEGRTLRQEARYFTRRGGLPLNLTTLPAAELTVVEYWTDACGQCEVLRQELDRFFAEDLGFSVQILRVFVDLGSRPRGG